MRAIALGLVLAACSSRAPGEARPSEVAEMPTPAPEAQPTPPPTPAAPPAPEPPAPSPTPSSAGLGAPADERACRVDEDCVLVSQVCGGLVGVARAHGDEVRERYRRIATVAECARLPEIAPSRPRCESGSCVAVPLEHPELRACRRDRDCMALDVGCQWSTAIARRSEEAARAALGPPGIDGDCPGILPMPPDVRCAFGFCAIASEVEID